MSKIRLILVTIETILILTMTLVLTMVLSESNEDDLSLVQPQADIVQTPDEMDNLECIIDFLQNETPQIDLLPSLDRTPRDVNDNPNNSTFDEKTHVEEVINNDSYNERLNSYDVQSAKELEIERIIVSSYLNEIHNISSGTAGICSSTEDTYKILQRVPISVHSYKLLKEKADLIAFFMPRIPRKANDDDVKKTLKSLIDEPTVENLRYVQFPDEKVAQFSMYEKIDHELRRSDFQDEAALTIYPWYFNPQSILNTPMTIDQKRFDTEHNIDNNVNNSGLETLIYIGFWTWPYFRCHPQAQREYHHSGLTPGKWLISYTVAFRVNYRKPSYELLSFDVDLTHFPINQCEFTEDEKEKDSLHNNPMYAFRGTHKCNKETTTCQFIWTPQPGWFKGSYACFCNPSHYAYYKRWNNTIPGYSLETKKGCFEPQSEESNEVNKTMLALDFFHQISSCHQCPIGCPDCIEKPSCIAEFDYPIRIVMLLISIICSIGSLALIVGVYLTRKRPIFSASSPRFICIMLLGCSIMYTEMFFLFPALSIQTCVAVKWTRHLGFCISYSALYMKLCRVYLTFRVKSAHKIKLTEKHLLHWMIPIMVIMLLYLSAWTMSHLPVLEVIKTTNGQRDSQCAYNWWDHVLVVGEVIFLAYGVFICWRIRDNRDAQFISYAIYNIFFINSVMLALHLVLMPNSGPNMKYFLAFLRTQIATTVTIALILGNKLYRVYHGNLPTMKEIVNSPNGFAHDVPDLDEQNSQLQDEMKKMAMQIERLKRYAMSKNNPHLKSNTHANVTAAEIDFCKMDNFTTL